MLAAVFKGDGVLALEERPMPHIQKPDDVLVKVLACGICGSDLHALTVPPGQDVTPGTIMGHEIYGEVVAFGGAVTRLKAGDAVVVDPNLKCGVCDYCKRGMINMCDMCTTHSYGQQQDGGFAPYVIIKDAALIRYAKKVSPKVGAQTEPLACVLNSVVKLMPSPLDNVVLYGAGPIGLLYLRCLIAFGVRNIIVCDISEYRRAYAKKCGATVVVDPTSVDMVRFVLDTWGELATTVIDAVGSSAILNQGAYLLQKGGKYMILGLNKNASSTLSPSLVNFNELHIMGSFLGRFAYPDAIKLISFADFGADLIVSHELELEDILEGFELAKNQKSARVIIYPNGVIE